MSQRSFWKMINAVLGKAHGPKINYNDVINVDANPPKYIYKSIFDFDYRNINDAVCVPETPEPISLAIKHNLYNSIRVSGDEFTVKSEPDLLKYLNVGFFEANTKIDVLNQDAQLEFDREIKENIVSNDGTLEETPICVIYSFLKGSSSTAFHVSAAIIFRRKIYPFGYTNADVLSNPTATPLLSQAVMASPEIPNIERNLTILDYQILTIHMVEQIEKYFINSVLRASIDVSRYYPKYKTHVVIFNRNELFMDHNYVRINTPITQCVYRGRNCASFMETVFNINCKVFRVWVSHPNMCVGTHGTFSPNILDEINNAIRENDMPAFMEILNRPRQFGASRKRKTDKKRKTRRRENV